SAIIASVVSISDATDAAFCSANRANSDGGTPPRRAPVAAYHATSRRHKGAFPESRGSQWDEGGTAFCEFERFCGGRRRKRTGPLSDSITVVLVGVAVSTHLSSPDLTAWRTTSAITSSQGSCSTTGRPSRSVGTTPEYGFMSLRGRGSTSQMGKVQARTLLR